uniref:Uncharacterized protein n=1 Tax=Arundo donax TaxID=35708 RepID=A0A0A9H0C9_ARUDO
MLRCSNVLDNLLLILFNPHSQSVVIHSVILLDLARLLVLRPRFPLVYQKKGHL